MIDPDLAPFLAEWSQKWSRLRSGATLQERRAHFEIIARQMRLPAPREVDPERKHTVATSSGNARVRVFRWRSGERQPCFVYMHGGAWSQGSPETHWDIAVGIAAANRQTVVSVDYALAPEHPFPTAVNQCRAVVEWAFTHADDLNIDRQRIVVGGDSAGGNLAAAVAIALKDTKQRLAGQLLIYPVTDFATDWPSMKENAEGPIIVAANMPATYATYCPDANDWRDPLAAPLHATNHAGLPQAYVAVAEHDPLRDSGIAYAEALEAADVPVTLDRGPGMVHGYLRAMGRSKSSRDRFSAMCRWLDHVNTSSH